MKRVIISRVVCHPFFKALDYDEVSRLAFANCFASLELMIAGLPLLYSLADLAKILVNFSVLLQQAHFSVTIEVSVNVKKAWTFKGCKLNTIVLYALLSKRFRLARHNSA